MKKEYMKPTTEVVDLKMNHHLLAGSSISVRVSEDEVYDEQTMDDL